MVGSCTGKTGSGANFSSAYKASLRKVRSLSCSDRRELTIPTLQFYEVQTTVYEKGSGWIMWTWKVSVEKGRKSAEGSN